MSKLYVNFTVTELSAGLASGEITAEELAIEGLERCERHSDLRALISQDREALLCSARQADQLQASGAMLGPLHGRPLVIKDNIDSLGLPTSGGTPALSRPKSRVSCASKQNSV